MKRFDGGLYTLISTTTARVPASIQLSTKSHHAFKANFYLRFQTKADPRWGHLPIFPQRLQLASRLVRVLRNLFHVAISGVCCKATLTSKMKSELTFANHDTKQQNNKTTPKHRASIFTGIGS